MRVASGRSDEVGLVEWISIVCRTRDRGVKISGKFDNSPPPVHVWYRCGGIGRGERENKRINGFFYFPVFGIYQYRGNNIGRRLRAMRNRGCGLRSCFFFESVGHVHLTFKSSTTVQ